MSGVATAIAGSAIIGGIVSSNAASTAANAQQNAANAANQTQLTEFQQQQANQQPYLDAGKNALTQIQNNMGYYNQPFTMDQFKQDPGYQFDLQQGQQALQRSSAVSNGLVSGNQLAALNNYSQNMASNEYQNAYNRFQNDRTQSFNRLASLAGLGQTGTQNVNAAGMNAANNVAQNQLGVGNANAASSIAQGNAMSSAIGGLGNAFLGYKMLGGGSGSGSSLSSLNYESPSYYGGANTFGGSDYASQLGGFKLD